MFNINGVSKQKTKEGSWGSFNGGDFLIAHTSNMAFQREFAKLQQPYIRQIEKGRLDPKLSLDILCKSLAKCILLDWKNVGTKDGDMDYSFDNAYKVLSANPALRDFVQEFSLEIDNFNAEVEEAEGKP